MYENYNRWIGVFKNLYNYLAAELKGSLECKAHKDSLWPL